MENMKATIKSIPVTEVTQGIHVCWEGATRIHFGLVEIIKDKVYATISLLSTNGHDTVPIDILKTIVAEYDTKSNDTDLMLVIENYVSKDAYIKQLPLKYSDWQQTIDDGLVDSGKEVEVEIIHLMKYDTPDVGKIHNQGTQFELNKNTQGIPRIEVAQLIPQQKIIEIKVGQLIVVNGYGYIFGIAQDSPQPVCFSVEQIKD